MPFRHFFLFFRLYYILLTKLHKVGYPKVPPTALIKMYGFIRLYVEKAAVMPGAGSSPGITLESCTPTLGEAAFLRCPR